MPGNILTIGSTIMCPHGGSALLSSSNDKLNVKGEMILIESDINQIMPGTCPFFVGNKYSPCVKIEWSRGTRDITYNEISLLSTNSVGKCSNAEGAVQGSTNIISTQKGVIGSD